MERKWKIKTTKFETKDELYDYICSNMRYIESVDVIGNYQAGIAAQMRKMMHK